MSPMFELPHVWTAGSSTARSRTKRFYLSRGFVESPLQPMTLLVTLHTVRAILAEA